MKKIVLTIKDNSRLGFLLELLSGLDYVHVEQSDEHELSDSHKQIIDDRLTDHKLNPNEGSNWEDIKKRLLSNP
mgnify:CR=1 FL=1